MILGKAHKEIIADLEKRPTSLSAIRAIYDRGKRIYDEYERLRKANEKADETK